MFHHVDTVTNSKTGQVIPAALIRLYDPSGELAALYADDAGTPIEAVSGVTNAAKTDNDGVYSLWVDDGTYDLQFSVGDAVLRTVRKIQLISGREVASDAEAVGGVENTKVMTPLRVAQAVDARLPLATDDAAAGLDPSNNDRMSSQRVKEAIQAQAPFYDDDGNVGIGAPSAGARLEAAGDVRIGGGGDLLISAALGGGRSDVQFFNDDEDLVVRNKTTGAPWLHLENSERVAVGTASGLVGSGRIRVRDIGGFSVTTWSAADYTALQFVRGGAQVGTVTCNSTTTAYNTTSDATLKLDQGIATPEQARAVLDLIQIHNFRWAVNNQPDIGVFAQELYLVYPAAVTIGGWCDPATGALSDIETPGSLYSPWAVDYSKLVPVVVSAVQDANTRLGAQEERIARLEALAGIGQ